MAALVVAIPCLLVAIMAPSLASPAPQATPSDVETMLRQAREEIQNFEKAGGKRDDPKHPGLHFKPVGPHTWSARVGDKYRALAAKVPAGFTWFWIGPHGEYERLIKG